MKPSGWEPVGSTCEKELPGLFFLPFTVSLAKWQKLRISPLLSNTGDLETDSWCALWNLAKGYW